MRKQFVKIITHQDLHVEVVVLTGAPVDVSNVALRGSYIRRKHKRLTNLIIDVV